MREYQELNNAPEYLKGREVTDKLKEITQSRDFLALAEVIGVPKSTISTWHQRGLTPFEIILRTHLRTGASVRYMALGEGEAFPQKEVSSSSDQVQIKNFVIQKGELVEESPLSLDKAFIERTGSDEVILLEHDDVSYFIDKNETKANQGKYLIDIDGSFSINELQRLPGKKLAISFNGSTINVKEDDIKVVGRVAMVMGKE